jgi:hypothetical protein
VRRPKHIDKRRSNGRGITAAIGGHAITQSFGGIAPQTLELKSEDWSTKESEEREYRRAPYITVFYVTMLVSQHRLTLCL